MIEFENADEECAKGCVHKMIVLMFCNALDRLQLAYLAVHISQLCLTMRKCTLGLRSPVARVAKPHHYLMRRADQVPWQPRLRPLSYSLLKCTA